MHDTMQIDSVVNPTATSAAEMRRLIISFVVVSIDVVFDLLRHGEVGHGPLLSVIQCVPFWKHIFGYPIPAVIEIGYASVGIKFPKRLSARDG